MGYVFKHSRYNHQIQDSANYPGVGPYKVFDGDKMVAVVREVLAGVTEEEGLDLRADCHAATPELRNAIDDYFPGRKVGYFAHGEEWPWRDNGTYETMPWGGRSK